MNAKKKRIPMYFSSLELENIKCFGKPQILDLKNAEGQLSQWTLILGENGVGKTTLLKCLSWMVPVEAPIENKRNFRKGKSNKTSSLNTVDIKPFMDDFDNENTYDQLIRMGKNTESRIVAKLANGVRLKHIPKKNQTVSIGMKFERRDGKLEVITPEKDSLSEFNSPAIFAYSASRHIAFKNIDNPDLKEPTSNLFSASGDLYDTEQVLSMLDNAARRHGKNSVTAGLLDEVKQILVDILPDVKDKESIIINSPINTDGTINPIIVEVETEDGKVKLLDLSLGYQTMLAWVVDLALRMLWSFPDNPDPLQEPAVVIIDEIDLHLHPIWQRGIREKLTFHFPNTQFICTAHSPFMAQASEMENLCVVNRRNKDVIIENEPLIVMGWRIGQIVTSELFGIPTDRGIDEERLIEERRKLIDKPKLTKTEKRRLELLDAKINSLPVIEIKDDNLSMAIQNAAHLLKKKGIIQ